MGINKTLMGYLDKSYSQYHAIALIKERLLQEGFEELEESSSFVLTPGKGYFVIRNDSSLIAFVPEERAKGFRIAASHSDSPTFKIKNDPVIVSSGEACLRVEPYGGMIMSTWMDKPLSIAGRLMVKKGKQIRSELFYINEDVAIIPNLCIHFNRDVNEGHNYNPDVDMIPLIGKLPEGFCWKKYLKEKAGLGEDEEILELDADLIDEYIKQQKNLGKTARRVEIDLVARIQQHGKDPKFIKLGEKLEELRDRHERGLIDSKEFLRRLLELAKEARQAEKEVVPEEEIDKGMAALTSLFNGLKNEKTPIIVERIVADIDSIVKFVRFEGWQNTTEGQKEVKRALRGIIWNKYKIRDNDVFNKAYSYIAEYY